VKIYQIKADGYYGGMVDVPNGTSGIPLGYTRTAVPVIPAGHTAMWVGTQWRVVPVTATVSTDVSLPNAIPAYALFDGFGEHKMAILSHDDPIIKAFILDCSVRSHVDLDDPYVQASLHHIESIINPTEQDPDIAAG
jgi:hypothetical protein